MRIWIALVALALAGCFQPSTSGAPEMQTPSPGTSEAQTYLNDEFRHWQEELCPEQKGQAVDFSQNESTNGTGTQAVSATAHATNRTLQVKADTVPRDFSGGLEVGKRGAHLDMSRDPHVLYLHLVESSTDAGGGMLSDHLDVWLSGLPSGQGVLQVCYETVGPPVTPRTRQDLSLRFDLGSH